MIETPQEYNTRPLEEVATSEMPFVSVEDSTLILSFTARIAHEWYNGLLTEQEAVRLMNGLQLTPGSEFVV